MAAIRGLLVAFACVSMGSALAADIRLVSKRFDAPVVFQGGNGSSSDGSISGDGRYLAFASEASNLSPADTNFTIQDVFVADRETGTIELVSAGGDGASSRPSISTDGRYVAFSSNATNLVADDPNGLAADVFLHDRESRTTVLVSAGGDSGSDGPSVSANGRFVAFSSLASNLVPGDVNGRNDVFVYDRDSGDLELLSVGGDASSEGPSISADGRFVAFQSSASNLVAGDSNGNTTDIFVHDRQTGAIELLTGAADGSSFQAKISANGRYVTFASSAKNLVPGAVNSRGVGIFVHDRQTATTTLVTTGANAGSFGPSISVDGRFVGFYSDASNLVPGLSNTPRSLFLHDRVLATTERLLSVGSSPGVAPSISVDAGIIAFGSGTDDLVAGDANESADVFLYDRETRSLELPTLLADYELNSSNSLSLYAALSANGQVVAFQSLASNLVSSQAPDSGDLFVYDAVTDTTEQITSERSRVAGNPSISADGRFITFVSDSPNLVPGDTNGRPDVFIYDRDTATTILVTGAGDRTSDQPKISASGRFVAFRSAATNLVAGDTNDRPDIFVYDRETEAIELLTGSGDNASTNPAISADGRYVAFRSNASNLVANDSNGSAADVFVYDRATDSIELVTAGGNGPSLAPVISGDGNTVAFASEARNLVAGDTNFETDFFVHDRASGVTELLAPAVSGLSGDGRELSLSFDGGVVAFQSNDSALAPDGGRIPFSIFVADRSTGTIDLLAGARIRESLWPSISADGRVVAFLSEADSLVDDDLNGFFDVLLATVPNPVGAAICGNAILQLPEQCDDGNQQDGDGCSARCIAENLSSQGLSVRIVNKGGNRFDYLLRSPGGVPVVEVGNNQGLIDLTDVEVLLLDGDAGIGIRGLELTDSTSVFRVSPSPVFCAIDSEAFDPAGTAEELAAQCLSSPDRLLWSRVFSNVCDSVFQGDVPRDAANEAATGYLCQLEDVTGDRVARLEAFTNGLVLAIEDQVGPAVTAFDISPGVVTLGSADRVLVTATADDRATGGAPIASVQVNFDARSARLDAVDGLLDSVVERVERSLRLPNTAGDFAVCIQATDVAGARGAESCGRLTVLPNSIPVADRQSVTTDEDTAVAINLTGSDADGDALTFAVRDFPVNGRLTGSGSSYSYLPNENFFGFDSFTFFASDGLFDSLAVTVAIRVRQVNDAPVAFSQQLFVDRDGSLSLTLSGTDVDGDPLAFTLAGSPANGSLSGLPPNLTYTPNTDFTGVDSFVFVARDRTLSSAPGRITINVREPNTAPVAVGQSLSTVINVAVPVTLTGSDADGDLLTFTVDSLPDSGSLLGQPPLLSYQPNPAFTGSDGFTFTAQDGITSSAPATIAIAVVDSDTNRFCGDPRLNNGTDRGTFLWQNCESGDWFLRVFAGGTPLLLTADGRFEHETSIIDVLPIALEPRDVLQTAAPKELSYLLRVAGWGSDGFNFRLLDGVEPVCFVPGADAPPMFLGAARDELRSDTVNLRTGFPCIGSVDSDGDGLSDAEESRLGTEPLIADTDGGGVNDGDEQTYGTDPLDESDDLNISCGLPALDASTTRGYFLGLDCNDSGPGRRYQLLVKESGSFQRFEGTLRADQTLSATGIDLDARDVLDTIAGDSEIDFNFGVSGSRTEGFEVIVSDGASTCLDVKTFGRPLTVGRAGLVFNEAISLETLSACVEDSVEPPVVGEQCGMPIVDLGSSPGLYLWQNCSAAATPAEWEARAVGGGVPSRRYRWQVTANALLIATGIDLEGEDTVDTVPGDGVVDVLFGVSETRVDGLTLMIPPGVEACVEPGLIDGAPFFVGANQREIDGAFNTLNLGACR